MASTFIHDSSFEMRPSGYPPQAARLSHESTISFADLARSISIRLCSIDSLLGSTHELQEHPFPNL